MNPNEPNVVLLERVAEQLGRALLEQLVFVGGAVAGVLITDPALPEIRPTQDVDVICSVIARSDYHELGRQLRQRGFQEDSRPGAPLCRWCINDLILDLMPAQIEILGFSNRWYPLALETAQLQGLPSGRSIRVVTAPVFLATKLEAFHGRGKGDYLFSHDLEDLMAVVDGRASLLEECRLSPPELRNDLAAQFRDLLNTPAFLEALPAFLPPDQASQQRLPDVLMVLQAITALAEP
ncbi:nucleotidyl transferase AbiEii/AbiGii toxin family protein [Cyanobium sp. L1E-Cus]|uniref:nucleotidyl transferase AbiEii/AbiGii toxin family protein n=1 Tax=Cyanobium sp. L1E-Cus TaxID=2823714 RepID=UPI0020CBA31F|nr:nucleotidyl transferase AbiEii/AbiGii toxin family protein [Cyanobium sp. L1E-Cus]MCP9821950.1 nucleotidyl transferase AbiEii/AbiGii toxin family protein [Cyanobium sp. L1E-Cus]